MSRGRHARIRKPHWFSTWLIERLSRRWRFQQQREARRCCNGLLSGQQVDIGKLRDQIESVTGARVIADAPPAGRFQYELKWDPERRQSFEAALQAQFGITLAKERRTLEVLVADTNL